MSDETPADARARRLAEALRANLRRRKAQDRARRVGQAQADAPPDDAASAPADATPETPWTA